ncbi:MAG: BolA family transcriptional regulator [Gammaproteobacteria bacterium]|nr:BolA family transcriptional regulator [Gammaproteobacteria bacterium]
MTETRAARIEARLREAFSPDTLLVKDQSHLHAGHAGAKDGRGHFEIQIVADAFAEKGRLESHRMIYEALGSMMTSDIHALSIQASANSGNLSE